MSSQRTRILDPRGNVNVSNEPLADRIDSMEGITLGLLDNSKKNADHLLDEIGDVLIDEYGVEDVVYRRKDKSPIPADDLAREIEEQCDAVVNAYGDCGSCTSWCIYDSVDIETNGLPVASVTTDEFVKLGQSEAQSLGMPGLPIITVPHPVADIQEEEVREKARGVVDEVIRVLTSDSEELEDEFTNKYLDEDEELGDEALYCPI